MFPLLAGVWQDQTWPDNWTAVTTDGKLSAQFEQTMVVTEQGRYSVLPLVVSHVRKQWKITQI